MALYGYDKNKNLALCSHCAGIYAVSAGLTAVEISVSDMEIGDSMYFYSSNAMEDNSDYASSEIYIRNDVNAYTAFSVMVSVRIWTDKTSGFDFKSNPFYLEDYSYQFDPGSFNVSNAIYLYTRYNSDADKFGQYVNWILTRVM